MFTSPEMGKAPGAQNAHELHLHVIGLCIARISKFLMIAQGCQQWQHDCSPTPPFFHFHFVKL